MIDEILPNFEQVANSWVKEDYGYGRFRDIVSYNSLKIEVCALADYIYGRDHPNSEMIKNAIGGSTMTHLRSAQGMLVGTASAVRNGLLNDLQTQILLDVQGDFIETARSALSSGAKDVAASLLCVVLEDSVKRLASKSDHQDLLGKEFTVVVMGLFKAGIITKAAKGVLLSHTDLRNAALHAQWHEVSADSVHSLLGFLPIFIEQHGI
ncbi:hypothetical protein [Xanthomonas bonasiae]|uniref:hypothetical protein n=1 Tax=Xanthomonas bonasiae TaxID=2810351 RepID=UPI00177DFFF2|nr:hypothetical protein [Xanthomonas surreyensis]MBD7923490.1 hypothetical protein [Xanthomonas surreyensis]